MKTTAGRIQRRSLPPIWLNRFCIDVLLRFWRAIEPITELSEQEGIFIVTMLLNHNVSHITV